MYFLFRSLQEGYTVVYEKMDTCMVYVIPPTGPCRAFEGVATGAVVNEFDGPKTVHLFDAASAGVKREPIPNQSKVIIFTSPNCSNYTQLRRSGIVQLTVPSYSEEEMDLRRPLFTHVADEEYKERLKLFGCGSIRLVLGLSMFEARSVLENVLKKTTYENLLDIVQQIEINDTSNLKGPASLFKTSLVAGVDKSNIDSYRKLYWNISSSYILKQIISKQIDGFDSFADKFHRIYQNNPGLMETASYLFEVYAATVLAKGGSFKIRELGKKNKETIKELPELGKIFKPLVNKFEGARRECTSKDVLHVFLNNMPIFDSYLPPDQYFNFTTRDKHPINMGCLLEMCKQLKGKDEKIHLYFVVPEDRFNKGWKTSQSFKGSLKIRNMKKLLNSSKPTKQKESLDIVGASKSDVELVADRVVQYALCIENKLNLHSVAKPKTAVRKFSTLKACNRSNSFSDPWLGVQLIQRVWRLLK